MTNTEGGKTDDDKTGEEEQDEETGAPAPAPAPAPTPAPAPVPAAAPTPLPVQDKEEEEEEEEEEQPPYFECLTWASVADEALTSKVWFVFTYPISVIFRFTVPDCNYPRFSGPAGYVTAFIMSIVHIALASHFLVDSATKFGCIVHMPHALMGLTIVAAGTSVPEAISSVVVAKSGEGDMAVSNAIGSNVFDILLGLGLPYFVSNVGKGVVPTVEVEELIPSIAVLYGILAAVVGILWWSNWMLNPKVGMSLFGLYFLYVIFAYIRGLN